MTAVEAKAIADWASANQLVNIDGFLDAIKKAAKSGRYEYRFGRIEPEEVRELTLLGFLVTRDAVGNVTVSWADAGAR